MSSTPTDEGMFQIAEDVSLLLDNLPDAKRRQVLALLLARFDVQVRELRSYSPQRSGAYRPRPRRPSRTG